MFRRLRVPAVCLVLLAFSAAQAQTATPTPQSKPRRFLMWKASSPTATLYLVGSIHVGDKTMYPLPPEVESAFAAAKVLTVEINIKNVDKMKAMGMIQQSGMYPAGDSLSKHITKETSDALDAFCTEHSLPRAGIEQLRPWVVAITIAALSWQQAGEDPELGVDMHFLNESKPPQRIDELETMESQLGLFVNATEEEQQALLTSTLKQGDKMKETIKQIQATYVSGDAEALDKLMKEQADTGSRSLTQKLLYDRNVTMTAKLQEYLKNKEQAFVVVGAGHIVGDKGIAQLLRAKGYKVEQVTLEAK